MEIVTLIVLLSGERSFKMTTEEYFNHKFELEKDHRKKIQALEQKYVNENAVYKIGDIIANSDTRIIVEVIKNSNFATDIPKVTYIGYALTKKNNRKRTDTKEVLYENDNLRLIKSVVVKK